MQKQIQVEGVWGGGGDLGFASEEMFTLCMKN